MTLAMRPDCERCGVDLPPETANAMICSFECTFCAPCAEALAGICPNCGGDLQRRPTRAGDALLNHPADTVLRYRA